MDGTSLLGSVFETTGTFDASNDYTLYYAFPSDFTVYDGDIVMVYILWGQTNDATPVDIWRPLPQNTVLGDGTILQYTFDYTQKDVQIYLEGSADFSTLNSADTDNQTFRIAVIPAAIAKNESIDLNSMSSVMEAMKVNPAQIENINMVKPL